MNLFVTILLAILIFGVIIIIHELGHFLTAKAVGIAVPFIAHAFQFTPIALEEYAIALGLAILIIPIMEIVKAVQRKVEKTA